MNLPSMVREHNINTIEFWKLVCIFDYIVAKKSTRKAEEFLKLTSFGSRVSFES